MFGLQAMWRAQNSTQRLNERVKVLTSYLSELHFIWLLCNIAGTNCHGNSVDLVSPEF